MESIKSLLSPLAPLANTALGPSSPLTDTLKLVVIGGTVETARRASVSAWNGFVDSFFLTAHFSPEDYPYDWLMHWLSKQPAWSKSREFEITTRSGGIKATSSSNTQDEDDEDLASDDEEQEQENMVHGRKKREVAFLPSIDTTHTIYYRGHWLRITRCRGQSSGYHHSPPSLKISTIARSNTILKKLVLEAKREYEKDAEHRVHIFLGDTTYAHWRWNGARQKRPMSSIVLQPGVKDMLLSDCKDFLASEGWYASRGIPFRRGYLLHGVPGSGKTSLIHSLAGELGLDIYVVSLSAKGMSDTTLTQLMSNVPSRCILLLEDLDAAFTRGVSRDAASTGAPTSSSSSSTNNTSGDTSTTDTGSTLSLSGLLNSLDGVAAAEGRLLFATTNHIERLDPALSRPGRMDVWVNFGNATREQAEGIFKCFFPGSVEDDPTDVKDEASKELAAVTPLSPVDISQRNLPGHSWTETILNSFYGAPTTPAQAPRKKRKSKAAATITVPQLARSEIAKLAKEFAAAIPEDELSVASLQGYLLRNKTRPRECVQEVAAWVVTERETREKIRKEKEKEKERKEKEEKEKKEKEEKEKKEAEDKLKAETEAAEKAAKAAETPAVAVEVKPVEEVKPAAEPEAKKEKDKEKEERKAREKDERRKARKAKKAAAAAAATASTSSAESSPAPVSADASSTDTPASGSGSESAQEPTPPPSSNETPVETESESSSPNENETDGGDADAEESDSASSTDGSKVKEKWVKVQGEEKKEEEKVEEKVEETK